MHNSRVSKLIVWEMKYLWSNQHRCSLVHSHTCHYLYKFHDHCILQDKHLEHQFSTLLDKQMQHCGGELKS